MDMQVWSMSTMQARAGRWLMIHQVSGLERCWSTCTLIFYCLFRQWYQPFFFLRARYLTFDDPNHISLDECKIPVFFLFKFYFCWLVVTDGSSCLDVFNTEAHPFKAAPASGDTNYGTGSPIGSFPPFSPIGGDLPAVSAISSIPGLQFGPPGILAKFLGIITGWLRGRLELFDTLKLYASI